MKKHSKRRTADPLLRTMPWKVSMVFGPIERILARLEMDGTVDTAGRYVVFKEDGANGWYDAVAALQGIIEFHQIAAARQGLDAPVMALKRFASKLDVGAPIFEQDIAAVRADIQRCIRSALALRQSEAQDIVNTVSIGVALESRGVMV
jgi:hypothetical protein